MECSYSYLHYYLPNFFFFLVLVAKHIMMEDPKIKEAEVEGEIQDLEEREKGKY